MLELATYLKSGTTTISNLLLDHYHELKMTHLELVLYLKLNQHQQGGDVFPDLIAISQRMGISQDEVYTALQSLLNKQLIRLVTTQTAGGKQTDAYDLTPLFVALESLLQIKTHQAEKQTQQASVSDLFQLFEQEFGRPLSPLELETIGQWLEEDHYDVELIRLGLKEAVLNQAYSLKYIDRILLNWERRNITSKAQVLQELEKRKRNVAKSDTQRAVPEEELPTIPLYNWMEPNNQ